MRTLPLMLLVGASCVLAGCGKKPKEVAKNNNTGGSGGDEIMAVDGGRVVNAGGSGGQNNPPPAPQGGGGGGNTNFQPGFGAAQSVRKAPRRLVSQNDLYQLGIAIALTADQFDRMPTVQEIRQSLQGEYKKYLAAIEDGSIILTGTTNRGAIWAYEVDADTKGGIVLVGGAARRAEADEVKQYLANK